MCRCGRHTTRADKRGDIPIDHITHAQFAKEVPAPTIGGTCTVKRADVSNSPIDCRKRRHPRRHGDDYRSRAIGRGAVADLAIIVLAPTIGYTRTGYRTGVIIPCANRRNGYPSGYGDGSGDQAIGRRSITDLADRVCAPTIHRTCSRQGTVIPRPRINRCKGNPSRHGSGSGGPDEPIARASAALTTVRPPPTIGGTGS